LGCNHPMLSNIEPVDQNIGRELLLTSSSIQYFSVMLVRHFVDVPEHYLFEKCEHTAKRNIFGL